MPSEKPQLLYSKEQVIEMLVKALYYHNPGKKIEEYKDYAYILVGTYSDSLVLELPGADYVINFGKKYPGMNIGQIYSVNPSYISWLLGTEDEDAVSNAKMFSDSLPLLGKKPLVAKRSVKKLYEVTDDDMILVRSVPDAQYIVTFGRHKGKTLAEIFAEDRSYIKYLHTKSQEETKRFVHSFLNDISKLGVDLDGLVGPYLKKHEAPSEDWARYSSRSGPVQRI